MNKGKEQDMPWVCDKCQKKLAVHKVKVRYLEGNFEVELMKCPMCGIVFIDEELALGKMLEVEKGLEDK
ncbi:DVU_1557 family redox protein [Geosporobacter ferrireducens]|uniref:DNA-binding protein n=1 Tax=Geosporobacter ferrireducens TaxID=1424294 RepID=A0A1D8GKN4_9FIRM|nr:CLJU_RS11820 family redox protein [Geosporobacter ferrireducens]AOT71464.1 DNA-binding protein [Geosporobacter ferrireducens]MTI57772.1 DNA-binding protein [Geosporobacter ferrireducens]